MQSFRPSVYALIATALFGVSVSNVWASDDVKKLEGTFSKLVSANSVKVESSNGEEVKAVSESSSESAAGSGSILDIQKMINGVVSPISGSPLLIGGPSPLGQPASLGGLSNFPAIVPQLPKTPSLDPDQAKSAINQGMAASMPLLLTYLNRNYPGQLLDVQLHSAGPGYIYEVRYLSNAVFLRTVYLDAITLQQK